MEETLATTTSADPRASARWFSANPGKAWAEKWFLLYSPMWMLVMALVMLTGIDESLGDIGFIVLGVVIASPLVLVPALRSPENGHTRWYQSYWFKANLYIAVFGFFGNYFGSEYFFDVLGMVYSYPAVSWNLDAALVGSGVQSVPLVMYLLTHAYFMTYHSSAIVVLRRIRSANLPGGVLVWPLAIFLVAYSWAWLETRAMANPLIADSFYYENIPAMLAYGSIFYALYFVVSFPVYYQIDENPRQPWDWKTAVSAALAVSMLVFYLLDFATGLLRW